MYQIGLHSKRLLDGTIEKGVSNWLTVQQISDFGFELSKQHFWDAICLRYGWNTANLPTIYPCGNRFSIQYCTNCKKGGFVSIRYKDLRDLTENMLAEVCKGIEIQLTGIKLDSRTANTTNEVRLGIRACGVWKRVQ